MGRKYKKHSVTSFDTLWANLVKKRDGKCLYCGKTEGLNAHHIFSRSKRSTRWYVPNGVTLCVTHHVFSSSFSAHKTPAEFVEWIKELKGEEWYQELRAKANEIDKRPMDEISSELKKQG